VESAVLIGIFAPIATIIAATLVAYQTVKSARIAADNERTKLELKIAQLEGSVKQAALMPGNVPQEFAAEIAHVNNVRVFRKDFTVELSFREKPDKSLEVEETISFVVVNLMNDEYSFSHDVAPASDQPEEIAQILRVAATGSDLSTGYSEDYTSPAKVVRTFQRTVRVAPNGTNPRNKFESQVRRMTWVRDVETFFFTQATLGVEVSVVAKPANLDVSVEFSHRDGEKMEMYPRQDTPNRWKLERAFLPWQAVYIEWHMKSPALPKAAQGSSEPEGPARP